MGRGGYTFLANEQGWLVRSVRPIEGTDFLSLTHLYQPLIGTDAFALYMTLSYQLPFHRPGASPLYTHSYLVNLLSITSLQLLEARQRLEGIGLLETYETETDKWDKYLEYRLIPPLAPVHFFASDILGAMLWERIGKERFQMTREWLFSLDSVDKKKEGRNVTKSFQEVFGVISPQAMLQTAQWQEATPTVNTEGMNGKRPKVPEQIDLEPIKMRLATMLGPEAWTQEVEEEIQEICFFYQLDSWGLIKALQNPYVTPGGRVDRERLREYVRQEYRYQYRSLPSVQRKDRLKLVEREKEDKLTIAQPLTQEPKTKMDDRAEQHFQRLAQISPLELLKLYHGGSQIARADVELVESLLTEFRLPSAVVNVLLDYVLIKYDRKLSRPLVEKIAGHWKRLGIQTLEQARNQCLKEVEEVEGKTKRRSRQDASSVRESRTRTTKNTTKNNSNLPEAVRNQLEGKSGSDELTDEEFEKMKAQLHAKMKKMDENFERRKSMQGKESRY